MAYNIILLKTQLWIPMELAIMTIETLLYIHLECLEDHTIKL